MKLTLEQYEIKTIVETPNDDLTLTEVIDVLVIPVLLGAGFNCENVAELFEE